jgi:hypothetical protein
MQTDHAPALRHLHILVSWACLKGSLSALKRNFAHQLVSSGSKSVGAFVTRSVQELTTRRRSVCCARSAFRSSIGAVALIFGYVGVIHVCFCACSLIYLRQVAVIHDDLRGRTHASIQPSILTPSIFSINAESAFM